MSIPITTQEEVESEASSSAFWTLAIICMQLSDFPTPN
jgi:hypothetical protein